METLEIEQTKEAARNAGLKKQFSEAIAVYMSGESTQRSSKYGRNKSSRAKLTTNFRQLNAQTVRERKRSAREVATLGPGR